MGDVPNPNDLPKIVHIDSPFKVQSLPLKDIYVLDNWLSPELHVHFDSLISRSQYWSKTNEVQSGSKTGLPHHQFWGSTFFRGQEGPDLYEEGGATGMSGIDRVFPSYMNRRLQMEFGFKWERFQYMGLNSQTQGLNGTTHADCAQEDDYNISFLYYTNSYWNTAEWGGKLRFYDRPQWGAMGRDEHIKNHQFAEVEFKANRLLMFDGRIPHGADAPSPRARYMDRKSVVLRGDEVRLIKNEEEWFDANDRVPRLQRRHITRL